jgi:hypothetical protein
MGIAELEPRQLAPTVGMTGSGSMDSPAPSPIIDNLTASTRLGGPASAIAVDSASPLDIDFDIDAAAIIAVPAVVDNNDKIDIDSDIDAAAVIDVPTVVDNNDKINIDFIIDTAVFGIAMPNVINTTSRNQRVTLLDRPSPALLRQAIPVLFRPQSLSAQPQARREQFRRSPEASTWPSDCSTSTWTTTESQS